MASSIIQNYGQTAQFVVPVGESVAIATRGEARLLRALGLLNQPVSFGEFARVLNGNTVVGPFSVATTVQIENLSDLQVFYQVGVSPAVFEILGSQFQATPVALNVTGPLTAAMILNGILTSTTAAAVAGTVPTGPTMELASDWLVGDSVDWSVVNTGPNTFTVTAAAGHTLVGAAAVATATTGRFRTVKTATDTFITYRIS